jgi:hypothetical protein
VHVVIVRRQASYHFRQLPFWLKPSATYLWQPVCAFPEPACNYGPQQCVWHLWITGLRRAHRGERKELLPVLLHCRAQVHHVHIDRSRPRSAASYSQGVKCQSGGASRAHRWKDGQRLLQVRQSAPYPSPSIHRLSAVLAQKSLRTKGYPYKNNGASRGTRQSRWG